MANTRIFLVDGKQVAIILATEHTYHVRFVKSGKFMEVYKKYVISYYPKAKKQKKVAIPKEVNPQQKLIF